MPMHSRTGFSTDLPGEPLYDFGMPNPFKYEVLAEDFMTYTAAQWTITETQAGATQAISAGESGGVLLLTNSGADNDLNSIQRVASGVTGEHFRWSSDRDSFFICRFKYDSATLGELVLGLQITDATPLDVTDGIFFLKADGSATISLVVEKNNTSTTTAAGTVVASTYHEVAWFYNADDGLFHIFFDGQEVGTSVATNAPDDEDLTVTLAQQNGSAAVRVLSIDYFMSAKKRTANWS